MLDNILVGDWNDLSTIKLADFGLSAKYDHVSFTTLDQHCGTLIFMAPEVALKKEYSKSVDIWSTGIILHMLLTGGTHPLYTSQDTPESYKKKLSKLTQLSFPGHLSGLAKNLFLKLTRFNIAQRYSAQDALKHPWITRLNNTDIPLTIPDQMKNLDLADRLRTVRSTISQ
jgi:serine/threonine protein kinase